MKESDRHIIARADAFASKFHKVYKENEDATAPEPTSTPVSGPVGEAMASHVIALQRAKLQSLRERSR